MPIIKYTYDGIAQMPILLGLNLSITSGFVLENQENSRIDLIYPGRDLGRFHQKKKKRIDEI